MRSDEKIRTVELSKLDEVLPLADHVIDVLPASPQTDELINADAVEMMRKELLPLATVLTANAQEAAALTGLDAKAITTVPAAREAARQLVKSAAGR